MSGPGNETLTAALRRLADERASGLLSVATSGSDVVIEIDEGTPVGIGPDHDVTDRVGEGASEDVVAVAVVDELVDRLVAAIVTGDVDWTWDVSSDDERRPVPAGLTQELTRRAVDAAQALATLDPGDVLEPAHAVATTGELDRVRQLFDGERTLADVAQAADVALPAVATMAAALVAGGALALDQDEPDDEPTAMSWTDTVAAADHEDDEDDDEPELWVMEPSEDDEDEDDEAPAAAGRRLATTPLRDVSPPSDETAPGDEPDAVDEPPPTRVDGGGDSAPTPATPVAPAASTEPDVVGASQDMTDTADQAGWNDTSWLDELSHTDADDDGPPVLAAGDDDARAALSSMLSDLEDAEVFGDRSSGDTDDEDTGTAGTDAPEIVTRREPRAEPGDVAEFLRELSRLALDDD